MKQYTIFICTYNGEKYLEKVLDSVYSQYKFESLIEEVIVVDNASNDSTKDIIHKYKLKQDTLKYVYESKAGLANARRHVKDVNTRWCIFLDDDNILMEKFIYNLDLFISNNAQVGVVNSNSIAYPDFELKNKDEFILRALLPSIACTHFNLNEIDSIKPAMKTPFGAGMAFLVQPVKEFEKNGWLDNLGRTENNLDSGEDGEIARIILNEGYEYHFNNTSSMYHIIPKFRINKGYIKKLKKGLTIGTYKFISSEKRYVIKRINLFSRRLANIILFPIRYINSNDEVVKITLKMNLYESILFIKYIIGDLFVIKRKKYN